MQDIKELSRRIEILSRVLNKELFSKSDLLAMFNVSEITISRDLRFLRSEGIPIYSKNKKIELTEISPEIERLLVKYISMIPTDSTIETPTQLDRIHYLNFIVYCDQAISNSKGIRMRYTRMYDNQEKEYIVIPKSIKRTGYNWILLAIDQQDEIEKQFYISRIKAVKSIELKERKTKIKKGSKQIYKMHFRFNKEVAEQIKSKVWFENYRLEILEDGRVDLFFDSEITDKLAGWCVSWWDQIEIICPLKLEIYIQEMCHFFLFGNSILPRP